jgi:hypothetical protein
MNPTPNPPAPSDPDTLRVEIEETRADLGDNVDALAAKADVPGRVKSRIAARREAANRASAQARVKTAPAAAKARAYATKARSTATGSSLPARIAAGSAAAAGVILALARQRQQRQRRRAAQAPWYRRVRP